MSEQPAGGRFRPTPALRSGGRITVPQRLCRRRGPGSLRINLAAACCAQQLESRLLLSTYTVTSTADSGRGSLRDAITNSSADTITFAVTGSILLNSQLQVSRSLTI